MTTQQTRRREQANVPYAPWAQVNQFLGKIRVLNPRVIDAAYLRANQMGGQQPTPLLATIQFLGLIDADGKPTPKLEDLRVRGEQQLQNALAKIVSDAYHSLYEAVNVEEADRDTLFNQIRTVYGCSQRVAESATPLFISLCREANMNVATISDGNAARTIQRGGQARTQVRATRDRPAQSSGNGATGTAKAEVKQLPSSTASWPTVHLDIQIHIDPATSPDQIDQIFASLARHFHGQQPS